MTARSGGRLWWAFVLFSAAYLPLRYALGEHRVFPFLGRGLSWVVTSWLAYLAVTAVLSLVAWMAAASQRSGSEPSLAGVVPSHWVRRTGVAGTDVAGLLVAAGLTLAAFGNATLFGWSSILAALFALTAFSLPVEPWPVRPRREIPVPPPPETVPAGEATLTRVWEWRTRSRPLTSRVALAIRQDRAEQRGKANPSHTGITSANCEQVVRLLAEEGAEDREGGEAARQLLAFARQHRFNYFEEAQNTLQFVQSVPYATDADTKGKEYFRYAIETLFENAGDCDCKAILAATLFRLMGLRSVVLISDDERHAAVAVEGAPDFPGNRYFDWNGARYYFCETTDSPAGFTVGEVPPGVNLDTYVSRVEIAPALLGGAAQPS